MDMQKTYRPLLRRYPLRTGNVNADRTKTHQWLISCGLKREKEGLIWAAQDLSLATRIYQSKIPKNGADAEYVHLVKKLSTALYQDAQQLETQNTFNDTAK